MQKPIMAALAAALLLGACSSRPREFNPTLASAGIDQAKLDASIAECKQLYVAGKLDSSGRLASAGGGAAAGTAVAVAGATAASGAGLYTGMALASATIVAIPIVALGGAWGMAKAKQKRKEKAIQTAMAGCLRERGYEVAGWTRAPKATRVTAPAKSQAGSNPPVAPARLP